jgi:hypothetical protein
MCSVSEITPDVLACINNESEYMYTSTIIRSPYLVFRDVCQATITYDSLRYIFFVSSSFI